MRTKSPREHPTMHNAYIVVVQSCWACDNYIACSVAFPGYGMRLRLLCVVVGLLRGSGVVAW